MLAGLSIVSSGIVSRLREELGSFTPGAAIVVVVVGGDAVVMKFGMGTHTHRNHHRVGQAATIRTPPTNTNTEKERCGIA